MDQKKGKKIMKNKIAFSGFMGALLISVGAANADPAKTIASQKYVDDQNTAQTTTIMGDVNTILQDYSTTTQLETYVTNEITEAIDDLGGDIGNAKADKKVPATAGNLAGLDSTGNLADSGISGATVAGLDGRVTAVEGDITTIEGNITTIEGNITSIEGDITTIEGNVTAIDGRLTTVEGDITTINNSITTLGTTIGDLGALADEDMVTTAFITDANVTKAKLAADVQTSLGKADTAVQSADLTTLTAGKEDVANKSNNIETDTGSTTKYTTVNAVQTYAIPKPSAACTAPSANCVLAVNSGDGSIYWQNVVVD